MIQGTNFANSLGLNIASSIPETSNNSSWRERVRSSSSIVGLLTTLQENQAYVDTLTAGVVAIATAAGAAPPVAVLAAIPLLVKLSVPTYSAYREKVAEEALLKKFANEGQLALVQLAIQSGVDINCPNYDKEITDLNALDIGKGFVEGLFNLWSRGKFVSDTFQTSWKGSSPLILAAYNGHKRVVEYLVEQNADLNMASISSTWEKNTALDWATRRGYREVEDYLMSKNARRESTTPFREERAVRAAMRP